MVSSGSRVLLCGRSEPLSFHSRRVRHAAAVRVLGRLGDPQPALLVPVEVHRLPDEGLGRDERQVELGMHLDPRRRIGRGGRSAFDVAEAVAGFTFLQELVHVRAPAGPRDPAQQDRPVVRAVEILVEMPGNRHERAIRRAAAVGGALVGPHLRLDVEDAHAFAAAGELLGTLLESRVARAGRLRRVGRGQNPRLGQHVHVVVNLVVHRPVRHVLRDRTVAVGEVEVHRPFEPPGRAVAPRPADQALEPVGVVRDRPGVDDDEPAAPRDEIGQVLAIRRVLDGSRRLRVKNEDVGLVELGLCGKPLRAGRLRAALVEQRDPFLEEARVVVRARTVRLRPGANEDAQRRLRPRAHRRAPGAPLGGALHEARRPKDVRRRRGGRDAGERGGEDGGEEEESSHGSRGDYSEASHRRSNPFRRRFLLSIVRLTQRAARLAGSHRLMPSVFLFATLDTKGREAGFVRGLLTSWGVPVTLVDVGALGQPAVAADVPRERIFELAGTTLEAVQKNADRGEAVTKAAEGAARLAREAPRAVARCPASWAWGDRRGRPSRRRR